MHEYHELTERLKHYGNWRDTDRDIRAYLKEKAEEIAILGDSAYSVGIETANKILGLTEKSLEEKFREYWFVRDNEEWGFEKKLKGLSEIATDHFNQQGER